MPDLQHAVALFRRVEQRDVHDARAAVAEVLELDGLDDDVARHAVPFEGLHHALRRRDLAIAPLEAVHAVGRVLDEAPVAAALDLHLLDDELVAAAPPLRDERRVGHRAPHAFARRVEDALDADLAVGRGRDRSRVSVAWRAVIMIVSFRALEERLEAVEARLQHLPVVARSRPPRRPAAAGPSRHVRTRPTFSVATSPASSSTCTCFFMPVRVMSNRAARSLIEASRRPSRSRMPRRVGSDSAAKCVSSRGEY